MIILSKLILECFRNLGVNFVTPVFIVFHYKIQPSRSDFKLFLSLFTVTNQYDNDKIIINLKDMMKTRPNKNYKAFIHRRSKIHIFFSFSHFRVKVTKTREIPHENICQRGGHGFRVGPEI